MPILRAVLMTRQAISPRLAIRIFLNMAPPQTARANGRKTNGKRPAGRLARSTPWFRSARPEARISSVARTAGRQAQLDAAGGRTGQRAERGPGDHVFVQRIGDQRTGGRTGDAARGRVLHAGRQRKGEKGEGDKGSAHL